MEELLFFPYDSGKILKQRLFKEAVFFILGNAEDKAGWGFGQPVLMKDVPAHSRGIRLDDL